MAQSKVAIESIFLNTPIQTARLYSTFFFRHNLQARNRLRSSFRNSNGLQTTRIIAFRFWIVKLVLAMHCMPPMAFRWAILIRYQPLKLNKVGISFNWPTKMGTQILKSGSIVFHLQIA